MNLFGRILPPVNLRFDSTSKFAKSPSSLYGIKRFGPYDANLFAQGPINCGIIYHAELKPLRDALVDGFAKGEGVFPGFATWFRAKTIFDSSLEKSIPGDVRSLRQAANELAARNCDMAFVLIPEHSEQMHREGKSIFLSNGIPCQVLTAAKFGNAGQRPYLLGNLALATYAKVGGTPWVIADEQAKKELVMGVSRAQDNDKRYVVGFVTLFNQDGDFLLLHSKTPVVKWDDYVDGLEELVVDAYLEYQANFGTPESLVIHFHKRPGQREIMAVENALNTLEHTITYALVHLNEFSAFRLFDTSHSSYVPQSGLCVDLSRHRSLLLLDGLEDGKRNRMGIPNVWEISLDKRSTIPIKEFPRLVDQIHWFSRVNWRGFNARATPVTINYSKLICDIVMEIGLGSWNTVISHGKLREKAWFL